MLSDKTDKARVKACDFGGCRGHAAAGRVRRWRAGRCLRCCVSGAGKAPGWPAQLAFFLPLPTLQACHSSFGQAATSTAWWGQPSTWLPVGAAARPHAAARCCPPVACQSYPPPAAVPCATRSPIPPRRCSLKHAHADACTRACIPQHSRFHCRRRRRGAAPRLRPCCGCVVAGRLPLHPALRAAALLWRNRGGGV